MFSADSSTLSSTFRLVESGPLSFDRPQETTLSDLKLPWACLNGYSSWIAFGNFVMPCIEKSLLPRMPDSFDLTLDKKVLLLERSLTPFGGRAFPKLGSLPNKSYDCADPVVLLIL